MLSNWFISQFLLQFINRSSLEKLLLFVKYILFAKGIIKRPLSCRQILTGNILRIDQQGFRLEGRVVIAFKSLQSLDKIILPGGGRQWLEGSRVGAATLGPIICASLRPPVLAALCLPSRPFCSYNYYLVSINERARQEIISNNSRNPLSFRCIIETFEKQPEMKMTFMFLNKREIDVLENIFFMIENISIFF